MIAARRAAFTFLVVLLGVAALFTPGQAPAQAIDPRIGVVEPHDAPAHADELGIGWGRARFLWTRIQPDGPDEWIDAELTDEELARELDAGREVVGLLIGVPVWARDERGLPQGLDLPHNDPDNLWAVFVQEAVTRYTGRIDHWIVWNEPDVWDEDHVGFTWPGTEADFVQLMRVSYRAIKAANPDAIVHLAAVSHWWDATYNRELYFERLLTELTAAPDAATDDHFYDVATLHLYFNPVDVHERLQQYHAIQRSFGLEKPIWLVETNAAPSFDPGWPVETPTFRVSLKEQAAYQPQVIALALAGGAERVGIYKLIDTPGDFAANPEPFGLVRADGSPRPAYRTAEVAVEQFAGAGGVTWLPQGDVGQVTAQRGGDSMRLLWSRTPAAQQINVPAFAGEATLIDMWGSSTPLTAEEGAYTVTLTGAECGETVAEYCMVGGPPVYLIEEAAPIPPDAATITVLAQGEAALAPLLTEARPPLPLLAIAVIIAVPLLALAGWAGWRTQKD